MKKINIVVLDAKPLINNDVNLERLYSLGEVEVYDRTADEQVIERAIDAEIVLVNKVRLDERHFADLPKLRYIGETATGVDNIDLAAAQRYDITVTNVPNYGTDSVAQHVIALLFSHCNHIETHNQSIQRGEWQEQPYFSYWLNPITELSGLKLGLLGYGKIAQKVALIAQSLGMEIIAHKPNSFQDKLARAVSLTELLQESDVLSLHCPLNQATNKIINSDTLAQMKASSIIINTSRGGLIDEFALAQALSEKKLTAAYLDVLTKEPPDANNPLLGLANCILTPHMAWASVTARKRLLNIVCENIIHFLNQQPINVVK
ncbi:Putative 2-hydroxyacid dehydrogenase [Legionella massiliensis]|uniref:Putative 2-hydroxyacid dehydrogenase n=1 Tax=Legionella massiliensis TaxID=1034943 RepID=A0A078L0Y0_9GAMM|nr:D-2-hydroxyacid dehydrogenase [Legionella massiliensis]CDZ77708.1 Putative 2-hydroxyacid dehydrogenase [Legionella massiliensis]CEE13446.1 Putative 2-hydroxyacid dehydrogenase [Legionella massiliensis]